MEKSEAVLKEQMNIQMYREHNISEWQEKCYILTTVEQITITHDLEHGKDTELTRMVELPFPEFCVEYFKKYPMAEPFITDPAFGYKLFLLKPHNLRTWSEILRNPNDPLSDIEERLGTTAYDQNEVYEMLALNLDEIPRDSGFGKKITERDLKYAYITQYIDTKKAQEMELRITQLFISDKTELGFDLEGKLSMLNPVARTILARTLGLYGYDRKSIAAISSELHISPTLVQRLQTYLFPLVIRPLGDFRQRIGYNEEINQDRKGMFQYTQKEYRDLDIRAEVSFIVNKILSITNPTPQEAAEQNVLSGLSNKKLIIYIVAKTFGWDTAEICKNLAIIPADIQRIAPSTDGKSI